MSDTFAYRAELQLHDGSTEIVNLEERGWAEPERLANTRVFSLLPISEGTRWPTIRVVIPEGAKPVFKTRNNVGMTAGFNYRTYAVGWFKDGETHWTWVLPNGNIEQGTDDPELTKQLTAYLNDEWRRRNDLNR